MRKGELVAVKSEAGKSVNFTLIDIDHTDKKIWVRAPTGQSIEMLWNDKRKLYVGRMARLEFTVDPKST
jgi:hypothetical protein